MTADAAVQERTRVRDGRWDRLRLLLAAVWLGLYCTAFVVHESRSDLATLYADVAAGRVERVELVGGLRAFDDGPPGTELSGYASMDVHWTADGDLVVDQQPRCGGVTAQLLDVALPGPASVVLIVAGLLTCALLVGGPEPWRATRWAWSWLLPVPFGVLALCLLSGPTPGLPGPRTERRLTGGWAFLIGSALGGVARA